MALVDRIPDRFVETYYGSHLMLRVDDKSKKVYGMYHPPQTNDEQKSALLEQLQGPGFSVLEGSVAHGHDHNSLVITGVWRHLRGPLVQGPFEMEIHADGSAKGWWSSEKNADKLEEGTTYQVRNPWIWKPEYGWFAGMVNSIRLTQYGVAAAWMFLFMTGIQLYLCASEWNPSLAIELNFSFNFIYTVIYCTFLNAYYVLRVRPSQMYIAGVTLYTIGYAAFVGLYWMYLTGSDLGNPENLTNFYVLGSGLFLTGSACLCYATLPKQWFTRSASLFWGSLAFLIGSVAFTFDSMKIEFGDLNLVVLGNMFFFPGRLCFLYGSATEECSILFTAESTIPLLCNAVYKNWKAAGAAEDPMKNIGDGTPAGGSSFDTVKSKDAGSKDTSNQKKRHNLGNTHKCRIPNCGAYNPKYPDQYLNVRNHPNCGEPGHVHESPSLVYCKNNNVSGSPQWIDVDGDEVP